MKKDTVTKSINKPFIVYQLPAENRQGLTPELKAKFRTLRLRVWRLVKSYDTIPLDRSVYLLLNEKDVDELKPKLQAIKQEYIKVGYQRAVLFIGMSGMGERDFKDNFLHNFEQKLGDIIKQLSKKGSVTERTLISHMETVETVKRVMADFKITDKTVSHLLVVANDKIAKREKQIGKEESSGWA